MIEQGFSGPVSRLEAAIIRWSRTPRCRCPCWSFSSKVAVETNDTARSRTMRESMGVPDAVAGRTEALRMWREDGPVWIREVKALNLPVT
jgi:hypothetical protein